MRTFLFLYCLFSTSFLGAQFDAVFIKNEGQWEAALLYKLTLRPYHQVYFQSRGLTFNLFKPHYDKSPHRKAIHSKPKDFSAHSFKINFKNASISPKIIAHELQNYHVSYFLGSESHWAGGVPVYKKLRYENLYQDIDLDFTVSGESLKYEFKVKAGANPAQIQFAYEGLNDIYLKNEQLYLVTSIDTLIELKPFSYQIKNGDTLIVKTLYHLEGNYLTYRFPDGYDLDLPLIIDPNLVFATVSGIKAHSFATVSTAGENGTSYSFGKMTAVLPSNPKFITGTGSFNETYKGNSDVSILKFDARGQLLYAALLGGNGLEWAEAARVDNNADLVLTGVTNSTDFPVTSTALDKTYNDNIDLFISKISKDGKRILGSTYLGGDLQDGWGIASYVDQQLKNLAFDRANKIYLAASTRSATLISGQRGGLRGLQDGFVTRLNSDLSRLDWLTYIGKDGLETATDLTVTPSGKVVVVGTTSSSDFPISAGTINSKYQGERDGYVALFDGATGVMFKSTVLGTKFKDAVSFIDIDPIYDQLYVMGSSLDAAAKPYLFFQRLDTNLRSTITPFFRKWQVDFRPTGFMVDNCGSLNLIGFTKGEDLPITKNWPVEAIQKQRADDADLYFARFQPTSPTVNFGTYYGGASPSGGVSEHYSGGRMNMGKDGNIPISTTSIEKKLGSGSGEGTLPTTPGAYATRLGSDVNQALVRFNTDLPPPLKLSFTKAKSKSTCAPVTITFTNTSSANRTMIWNFGDPLSPLVQTTAKTVTHTYTRPGKYIVQLEDACSKPAYDTITVHPGGFTRQKDRTICVGDTVNLKVAGALTYTWTPATGLSASNIPNPRAFPKISTTYYVAMDNGKCIDYDTVKVDVIQSLKVDFKAVASDACDSLQTVLITNNTVVVPPLKIDYNWVTDDGQKLTGKDLKTIKINKTGALTINLDAGKDRCLDTKQVRLDVGLSSNYIPRREVSLKADKTFSCGFDDPINLEATGGESYTWTPALNLSNPNISNPVLRPTKSTTYKVKIMNKAGCTVEDSIAIRVADQITFKISSQLKRSTCASSPLVIFKNENTQVLNYHWDFGDGQVSTAAAPTHTYTEAGTYKVKVRTKNPTDNCLRDTTFQFKIEKALGYNAFSPNGDGTNEVFDLKLTGWDLEVYNRWGRLVYEQKNYQNNWTGDANSAGTYYYILHSPEGLTCRGWVVILK